MALVALLAIGVLYSIYVARLVLMPVTLALLASLLLAPVVARVRRFGVPRALAAGMVVSALLAAGAYGAYRLGDPAVAWLDRAPQSLSDVQERLQVVTRGMERIAQATEKVDEIASPGGRDADQVAVANGPELSDMVFSGTRSLLVGGTVTVVLIYFLLASGDLFLRKLVRVLPRFRNKRNAVRITRDAQQTVSYYLLTMSLINVGLAVVQALAMWALGVPNPLLWGVMAGVLNYIPYIGPIVGTGVVSLVALIAFDELSRAMLVPGIYLLVSVLEGNLVTPILLGRSLTMNPVVIFIWVLFWGWMWGVVGALVAVPILATVKIVCDHVEPLAPVGVFLSR